MWHRHGGAVRKGYISRMIKWVRKKSPFYIDILFINLQFRAVFK
jgi:hypothetical protein